MFKERRKGLISALAVLVVGLVAAGYYLVAKENRSLDGLAFIYMQHQSLAQLEGEAITVSFLFVDADNRIDAEIVTASQTELLAPNGEALEIEELQLQTLKEKSLLSPYAIHKLTMSVTAPAAGSITEAVELHIEGVGYPTGETYIYGIAKQEYPDIGIGSSPFLGDYEFFESTIENREPKTLRVDRIFYWSDGKEIDLLPEGLSLTAGEEVNLSLPTQFETGRNSIRPVIEYRYDGDTYQDVFVVVTEYTPSLSKDQILEYRDSYVQE